MIILQLVVVQDRTLDYLAFVFTIVKTDPNTEKVKNKRNADFSMNMTVQNMSIFRVGCFLEWQQITVKLGWEMKLHNSLIAMNFF